MLAVGVLYLLFEKSIVTPFPKEISMVPVSNGVSRSIIGLQIGLIALAMLVTRSSVTSLQAKRGLPLGNQVMGWLVLGMLFL